MDLPIQAMRQFALNKTENASYLSSIIKSFQSIFQIPCFF